MTLKTPPTGNSVQTAARGQRFKRAVVSLLLIGLIAEVGLEASSRYNFQKSLTALTDSMRAEQQAGRKMSAGEAAKLISGWPSSSQKEVAARQQTEFRWYSFVWDLRLQLRSDADGLVEAVTIGNGVAPVLSSPAQTIVQQAPQSPVQSRSRPIRGASAVKPPALTLLHKGDGFSQNSSERSRLLAEIVRQALLITARDEFDRRTRDIVLGEAPPDDDDAAFPSVTVFTSVGAERRVEINVEKQYRDGTAGPVALFEFQLPQGPLIDTLVAKMDAMSVDEFKKALNQVGFDGKGHKYVEDGTMPEHIAAGLDQFEVLSQLGAIRALHSEIRDQGESPETLAGLARGYAHISALTQFLWSPAYKVFGARGLLYAERLMRLTSGNSFSLRHRAYVRALVGLHTSALDDLARAAAAPGERPAPDWLAAIDAFCHCNLPQLSKLAEQPASPRLPRLLKLLLAAPSEVPTVRLESAVQLLQVQSDCELAFDVALDKAALGVQRQMTGQCMATLSSRLRDYLRSTDGIPPDIRKIAKEDIGDLHAEMAWQSQIISALREAASVDRDGGEPSLAVLAQLIQEISFAQACRLLDLEKFSLSVDSSETLAAIEPILKNHRYEGFAQVHAWDHTTAYKALLALHGSVNRGELDLAAGQMLNVMDVYWSQSENREALITPFGAAILEHGDRTYGDLARALRIRATDFTKIKVAAALREVSPGSGLATAAAIKYDWEEAEASAADWETKYTDDVGVQGALAEQYTTLKRFDDAVRCRKRQLELLPEQTVFRALADLYWGHGDEQLWFETVTASLAAPSFGLEHARAHADLAYFHMRRKEWDAARPHADLAARSYSSWGLLCAAALHERIGDWNQANLLRRANAERYTTYGEALDWYFWCRGTGHGDVAAARAMAQDMISKLKTSTNAHEQDQLGLYYVLEDKPSDALSAFREGARLDPDNPFECIHAALLADELGQATLRDELLHEAHKRGDLRNKDLVEIITAFQNCLDSGSQHLDLPVIEWAIRDDSPDAGRATNAFYFVGRFLALRGREAESRDYLQRAATSPEFVKYNCKMAAHALLSAGVALGERRDAEFDEQVTQQLKSLNAANEFRNSKVWDKALTAYEKLIAEHPDFADARFERALGFRDREEFGPAIADLTRAHELVPGCAQFLLTRAQVREYDGQYAAAIADYEEATRIDRLRSSAHYSLAYLRAACPEQVFRDGKQALERARIVQTLPNTPTDLKLALLAAAKAESGAIDDAIGHQTEALRLAPNERKELAAERLQVYQRGEAYRRKPAWWRNN